ncbi:Flp pilus assembly protein CpaB [Nocardioides flavescens]|uniref:Flp pilus assembly protein CpaB n=1 Tax=Nocardioides flavescens TaxID=2691959 RepID=A0A6L7F323_9ACTN|nr:Flp pilus assembly protein CpaB [Nocardioides flavescens]MXG90784.1 Flp pilus assembly protein CpaB [Nocardioides flavescens]
MDRRRILLVVAVLVAAAGSALVFLYSQGADDRAAQKFDTVQVLEATALINPGETIEDAQAAGKLALRPVSQESLLDGYQVDTSGLAGTIALGAIYPGEQIIAAKFGATAAVQSALQVPDGMMAASVNLTDPGRVAGFVNPGSEVAVFMSGTDEAGLPFTRVLLDRVTVLAVGSTTPVSTTTTDETGASTTEQLPRTLITLALDQTQVEKVTFASTTGELSFALLTDKSAVQDGPGVTAASLFQ